MAQLPKWFGILGLCTVFVACSSGSSDDDDVSGGGSSGSAGTAGGKGGAGSGGQSSAGAGDSDAGENGVAGESVGGQAAGGSDGTGACCVEEVLTWGRVGGHVVSLASSSLGPCAVYSHEQGPLDGPPTDTCTQGLAVACAEDGLGPDDVLTALSDSDVVAAIAAAPVLYGTDPRPYDGQLLEVTIGDAVIQVGDECMEQGCTSIPPGVQALADLLLALDEQELASTPCANVFQ